jgi:hypothetical protein
MKFQTSFLSVHCSGFLLFPPLFLSTTDTHAEYIMDSRSSSNNSKKGKSSARNYKKGRNNKQYEDTIFPLLSDDCLLLRPNEHVVVGIDVFFDNSGSGGSKSKSGGKTNLLLGHLRVPIFIDCFASSESSSDSSSDSVVASYGPWYVTAINERIAFKSFSNLSKTKIFLDKNHPKEEIESGSLVVLDGLKKFLKKVKRNENVFRILSPNKKNNKVINGKDSRGEEEEEEEEESSENGGNITNTKHNNSIKLSSKLNNQSPTNTLFVNRYSKMPSSTTLEVLIRNDSKHEQIYHVVVTRPLVYSGSKSSGLLKNGETLTLYVSVDASIDSSSSSNSSNGPSPMGGITDGCVYVLDALFTRRCTIEIRVVYVDDMEEVIEEEANDVYGASTGVSSSESIARSLLGICHSSLFNQSNKQSNQSNNLGVATPFLHFGTLCSIDEQIKQGCTLVNRSGLCIYWKMSLVQMTKDGVLVQDHQIKDFTTGSGVEGGDDNNERKAEYSLEQSISDGSSSNSIHSSHLEGTLDAFSTDKVYILVNGVASFKKNKNITHVVLQYHTDSSNIITIIMNRPVSSLVEYPKMTNALEKILNRKPDTDIIQFGDVQCGVSHVETVAVVPKTKTNTTSTTTTKPDESSISLPTDVPWTVLGEDYFTILNKSSTFNSNDKENNNNTSTAIVKASHARLLLDSLISLRFEPLMDGVYTSTVSFVRKDIIEDITVVGRSGRASLTSVYGKPSISGTRLPPIDLGVFHCNVKTTRSFEMINDGTLDVRILNILACLYDQPMEKQQQQQQKETKNTSGDSSSSSTNEAPLEYSWSMPTTIRDYQIGIHLVEGNQIEFGEEWTNILNNNRNNDVEVDWDEVDYVLHHHDDRSFSTNNDGLSIDTSNDAAAAATTSTDEHSNSYSVMFPIVLRPGQKMKVYLHFKSKTIGKLRGTPSLQISTERQGKQTF